MIKEKAISWSSEKEVVEGSRVSVLSVHLSITYYPLPVTSYLLPLTYYLPKACVYLLSNPPASRSLSLSLYLLVGC